ncbi:MAG: N-acyl homoserine lactonase family protein [Flavobacteriaceae bacterium]|nr:N-acyl homoserine lactonase family protein [Flavobacteriaceae bacterium]
MKLKILTLIVTGSAILFYGTNQIKVSSLESEKSNLKMYVLDGGYMVVNDLSYFTQDESYNGQKKIIDNPVFIIEHEKGRLIWDVGLPDRLADRNPSEIDTTQWILFYVKEKLIDQIHNMNMTPDSFDYIIVSHSHSDHIGNANYFKTSTWIVDERELEWAMREKANTKNYDSLLTAQTAVFKGKFDVFGDNSVIVHSMPGHTPGHMILQIELKNETLFLSGDLYHFNEQRQFRRVPQFNYDVDKTLESMNRFEELVNKLNAKVIIQHERNDYKELPVYPEYWE